MARVEMKGYNILLAGNAEIPADNSYRTNYNGVTATLKLLNKTAYNKLKPAKEDTICFKIIEE